MMDEAMRARGQLLELVNALRRVLKDNDRLSDMAVSARVIEMMCAGGMRCSDESHGQHHHDLVVAQRALDAAFNRWAEVRAHLALAAHALRPPKDAVPTEETASAKDPSELN